MQHAVRAQASNAWYSLHIGLSVMHVVHEHLASTQVHTHRKAEGNLSLNVGTSKRKASHKTRWSHRIMDFKDRGRKESGENISKPGIIDIQSLSWDSLPDTGVCPREAWGILQVNKENQNKIHKGNSGPILLKQLFVLSSSNCCKSFKPVGRRGPPRYQLCRVSHGPCQTRGSGRRE